jgi:hypothetical protein
MRTLSLLAAAILINLTIYSQEIIVSKDSLSLFFDDVSFTSQDSLMIYNVGTTILNIDTIYCTEASGFVLTILLNDTTIHSAVTWRENFYTPFSIEPNDSAKLVFIYPLWIPEYENPQVIWTDSIVILNNSLNNNILLLPTKVDFPVNVYSHINFYPEHFLLSRNYPNPFNPTTTIKYQIPQQEFVTINIYDILGNVIATLVNGEKRSGSYEVEFSGAGLPSGIYFYQLSAGSFIETKKMILIK